MNVGGSFWDDIRGRLTGKFKGTENTDAINSRIDSGKGFEISNPTSYRTFYKDGEERDDGSQGYIGGNVEIGKQEGGNVQGIVSTAVKNARYEPEDDSLNIRYTSGDKEYKFKAGGKEGLEEWINSPSKGRITQEWRTTHRYPGY